MKTLDEIRAASGLRIVTLSDDGFFGDLWIGGKRWATVICSWGGGWDHVSVAPLNHNRVPTWDEMCRFKEMFFRDDEVVVQYHPRKEDYVNRLRNCLHLWRPQKVEMPTPPKIYV